MNALNQLAVAKAIKEAAMKKARAEVKAGEYSIDVTVRIVGGVKVGVDFDAPVTASLPQKKMLLAAIMLNGVSVDAFLRRYQDGEFEVSAEQEEKLDAIWKKLVGTTVQKKNGVVTTALTVEELVVAP